MQVLEPPKRKKKPRKIKLGTYPYTYVRTVVMRTLLLKKGDYDKLMKMSLNEIAKFLQDSTYKEEIDKLAEHYSGAELVERALNKNLIRSFNKLKSISPEKLNLLIDAYLKREDIFNIKTILRGKYTKTDDKEIESLLLPVGTLNQEFLLDLLKKQTIEEILKNLKIIDFKQLEKAYEAFKKNNMLIEIENVLDKHYYKEILKFMERIPKQGKLFKEFLKAEIDILNLITMLRLKRENLNKDEIKKYLFLEEIDSYSEKLLDTKNMEEFLSLLQKSKYSHVIKEAIKTVNENKSIIPIEMKLYKYLLEQSELLQHQHPLSIDIILGYMFAKEIETRNLRVIVKGKQLNLSNEFIENELVV